MTMIRLYTAKPARTVVKTQYKMRGCQGRT